MSVLMSLEVPVSTSNRNSPPSFLIRVNFPSSEMPYAPTFWLGVLGVTNVVMILGIETFLAPVRLSLCFAVYGPSPDQRTRVRIVDHENNAPITRHHAVTYIAVCADGGKLKVDASHAAVPNISATRAFLCLSCAWQQEAISAVWSCLVFLRTQRLSYCEVEAGRTGCPRQCRSGLEAAKNPRVATSRHWHLRVSSYGSPRRAGWEPHPGRLPPHPPDIGGLVALAYHNSGGRVRLGRQPITGGTNCTVGARLRHSHNLSYDGARTIPLVVRLWSLPP